MVKLFFVESSPTARSRKDTAAQQAKIRSHAAIAGHHSKARLRTQISEPSSSINSPSSPASSFDGASIITAPSPASSIGIDFGVSKFSIKSRSYGDSEEESSDSSPGSKFYTTSPTPTSSSLLLGAGPCFHGTRTDPFNCISTDHPHLLAASVDYFSGVTVPAHSALYELFDITNIYNGYWFELMSDPDFAYSGVCLTLRVRELSCDSNAKPSEEVLLALGIALSRLRKRIANTGNVVDDISVTAVSFMAAIAKAIGDSSTHQKHKQALKYMVKARGGLDKLGHDGMDKCLLLQREGFWSIADGSTIFGDERENIVSIYPKMPLSGVNLEMTMSIPLGFRDLAHLGKLSVQVLEVLVRTQQKAQMEKTLGSAQRLPELFKTHKRRYSDFHEACPCLSEPDVDGGASIEKLSVLAVIIYCSTIFTPTRSTTVLYDTCRKRLQSDIATIKPDSAAEAVCLTWVAAMLVWSWTTVSGQLTQHGISCLAKLKTTILRDIEWTELESILGNFFWSEKMSKSLEVHYLALDTG
ncbi:hypothetical protein PV08_01913 [Exophiala spinifera]|uniref:Transcription factor domain-containing protein n=1 Tax=Exophiala spinifera TaxID=91928 RepID=A0A0D2BQQ7_9EURO|nr:uncharacterized protein PV08_01913 [Exophiala spinifera]KIW21333.1 hypothetical protein PV08_01913 [Exophiala spinifera]